MTDATPLPITPECRYGHGSLNEIRGDEGAGPYLKVQFRDDEPAQGDASDMGYFCTHEDIDAFAGHLHHALKLAQGEKE